MRRVAIIQARMSSTRLPGKVLLKLGGRPMLAHQLARVARCQEIDECVVATTRNPDDDAIVSVAKEAGVRWYRGSEHDVLERYHEAAREARAEIVIRLTSDCPLIDPQETDRVIAALAQNPGASDFAANFLERTYPRGLETEALFFDVLERVSRLARSVADREHVTRYIYVTRPELFLALSLKDDQDNADLRWTVDTAEDFALIKRLFDDLELHQQLTPYRDILAYVRANPEIILINAGVPQKAL